MRFVSHSLCKSHGGTTFPVSLYLYQADIAVSRVSDTPRSLSATVVSLTVSKLHSPIKGEVWMNQGNRILTEHRLDTDCSWHLCLPWSMTHGLE